MGFQQVVWIGNLGQDPELRSTQNGQEYLKLRVACSETYLDRNRERQESTEWIDAVIWGKRARALAPLLSKGAKVTLIGKLRTNSWEDDAGNRRTKTELKVTEIELGGTRGNAPQGGSRNEPEPSGYYGPDDSDDIPF